MNDGTYIIEKEVGMDNGSGDLIGLVAFVSMNVLFFVLGMLLASGRQSDAPTDPGEPAAVLSVEDRLSAMEARLERLERAHAEGR
jgi:hypothetical protein